MPVALHHRPYPLDRAPELPPGVATMMKPAELDLLYSIARHYCTGEGCIVDAGVFLGASTACFAEGLARNPAVGGAGRVGEIHTFERAIVTPAMLAVARLRGPEMVARLGADGSNYAPLLGELLGGYPGVELHVGDILAAEFAPRPIEVLFLDILKSPRIQDQCIHLFMAHLIPGRSLIVQQDYFWHFGWFINAYMERHRDCFEMVDSADTSAVFQLVKPLPEAALAPQAFGPGDRHATLALLEAARWKGETLAQYLTYQLGLVAYTMQEMGALLGEVKLRAFEARFGDLMIEQSYRLEMQRVVRAHGEIRNRIRKTMDTPGIRKILID